MPEVRKSTGIKWVKLGRDDYKSACGRWKIVRLEADINAYRKADEWILADGTDAVDVFRRLKDAKAEAEELQSKGWEIEKSGILYIPEKNPVS